MATVRSVKGIGPAKASQEVRVPPSPEEVLPKPETVQQNDRVPTFHAASTRGGQFPQNLDQLFRTSAGATAVADLKGVLLAFNSPCAHLFGYQPDELVGHNLITLFGSDLSSFLDEAQREEQGTWYALGHPLHFVLAGVKRNGDRFSVYLTLTPLSGPLSGLVLAAMRERAGRAQANDTTSNGVLDTSWNGVLDTTSNGVLDTTSNGVLDTTSNRVLAKEMTTFQRELLVQVVRGRGPSGIAEALHHRTGRKVTIHDALAELIASAGTGSADLELNEPAFLSQLSPLHAVCQRRGGVWAAASAPDQAVLGWICLYDPCGDLPEEGLLALELATSILTSELLRMSDAQPASWTTAELAEALLESGDIDQIASQAQLIGYAVDRSHRAVAVEVPCDHVDRIDLAEQALRGLGVKSPVVTARSKRIVILAVEDLDWEELAAALGSAFGTRVRVGVGKRREVGELARSFEEARFALEFGAVMAFDTTVTTFDNLGIWRMLVDDGNPRKLQELIDDWIGELIAHDLVHSSELVKTLSVYLDKSCGAEAASSDLYIHRNTLRYRLAKIAQVTGRDLSDAEVRFQLQIACRAWTVLQALNVA